LRTWGVVLGQNEYGSKPPEFVIYDLRERIAGGPQHSVAGIVKRWKRTKGTQGARIGRLTDASAPAGIKEVSVRVSESAGK